MEADGVFHMNKSDWRHPGTLMSHKHQHQVVALPLKLREAGLLPEAVGTTSQVNMSENKVLRVGKGVNGFGKVQNR